MQIPVDENGLEWWEKLPVEKQDRFPLPPPTPESIEDIHWQLIVELDQKALEAAVKDSGKLPGEHCGCKACRVHKSNPSPVTQHALTQDTKLHPRGVRQGQGECDRRIRVAENLMTTIWLLQRQHHSSLLFSVAALDTRGACWVTYFWAVYIGGGGRGGGGGDRWGV